MHARWSLCLPAVTLTPSFHITSLSASFSLSCSSASLWSFQSFLPLLLFIWHLRSRLSSYKVIIFSIIGALLLCSPPPPPQASSELLLFLFVHFCRLHPLSSLVSWFTCLLFYLLIYYSSFVPTPLNLGHIKGSTH